MCPCPNSVIMLPFSFSRGVDATRRVSAFNCALRVVRGNRRLVPEFLRRPVRATPMMDMNHETSLPIKTPSTRRDQGKLAKQLQLQGHRSGRLGRSRCTFVTQFVDVTAGPRWITRVATAQERIEASRVARSVCSRQIRRKISCQLIHTDPAANRLGFQPISRFGWNLNTHGHAAKDTTTPCVVLGTRWHDEAGSSCDSRVVSQGGWVRMHLRRGSPPPGWSRFRSQGI